MPLAQPSLAGSGWWPVSTAGWDSSATAVSAVMNSFIAVAFQGYQPTTPVPAPAVTELTTDEVGVRV